MDRERRVIESLFEALYRRYGWDFRQYSHDTARRRILRHLVLTRLSSLAELRQRVLSDEAAADRLFRSLSINVTEMFRDPAFFRALREQVLPALERDRDPIRVWHAGCASGEEVYSMAILLSEAGLYGRSRLYGTDFNHGLLMEARAGIFPLEGMRRNVRNYQAAGGVRPFSDYYRALHGAAVMDPALKKNLVFAPHNLVSDRPVTDFCLIICRNVLIYYEKPLQHQILRQLHDSLRPGGFLCLGSHEDIRFSPLADRMEPAFGQPIFRKAES